MMNAGLGALAPNAPNLMPGQAAPNMAGVLPPPSQAAPNAVPSTVAALVRLPPEVLQQLYRNPPKGVPTYAIIAARDQQIKDERLRQAQQGLMAQQQVAGQQGTVADNLMAVRAASGGEMRVQGYAGGNEVRQGVPFPGWENPLVDADGLPRSPTGRAAIEARNRQLAAEYEERNSRAQALAADREAAQRRMQESLVQSQMRNTGSAVNLPAQAVDALQQWNPVGRGAGETAAERAAREARALQTPVVPRPDYVQQAGSPAETAPVRDAAGAQQTPPPASRGLGAARTPPPAQTPPPAAAQQRQQPPQETPEYIRELMTALRGAGQMPPEILEQRKALSTAQQAQLDRQRAAIDRYTASMQESDEDKRTRRMAAILKGLASADRLGPGLAAAGAAAGESDVEARRASREGMKEVMTLEDAAANLQIAMQQQALADATGDYKAKTAAAVAVAQAQRDLQKATIEQIRQQQLADAESKRADAAMIAAGKTGSSDSSLRTQQRLALQSQITALEDRAKDLARPEAERRAAEQQAAKLRRRMNALLELETGSGATESTAGTQYDFDPATGKLVPRAQ